MALASPDTLDKEESSVRASVSGATDVFGPALAAGSVGGRRGLGDRLEATADLTYLQVTDKSVAGTNRGIAMARAGAKYRPTQYKHLALVAGLGGGYAPAAGPYLSADAGAVIGYENRYVIPYLSAGAFGSVPLNPSEVDVTGIEDDTTHLDTPEATIGLTLGVGLKIPVRSAALHFGLTSTRLWDNDSSDAFLSMGAGVETSF